MFRPIEIEGEEWNEYSREDRLTDWLESHEETISRSWDWCCAARTTYKYAYIVVKGIEKILSHHLQCSVIGLGDDLVFVLQKSQVLHIVFMLVEQCLVLLCWYSWLDIVAWCDKCGFVLAQWKEEIIVPVLPTRYVKNVLRAIYSGDEYAIMLSQGLNISRSILPNKQNIRIRDDEYPLNAFDFRQT